MHASIIELKEQLRSGSLQLPRIAPVAVEAYERETEKMVQLVDERLVGQPQLHRLIGINPIAMMRTNHRNHAGFMINVFDFEAYGLLAEIVAWVYRAYRNHGFSFDYFPLELEAWREAVGTCLPAAEADSILRVYEWMQENHEGFIQLAEAPNSAKTPWDMAVKDPDLCRGALKDLLAGNYPASVSILKSRVRDLDSLISFYADVLQPCLYEVGRLWEVGRISAAEEHLATAVAERVISTAYVTMATRYPAVGIRPGAVIATTPDEAHGVGVRMVSDVLEMKGWDVHFLGVNVPMNDVTALVKRTRPAFVGLSMVMPYNLRKVHQIIGQLRTEADDSLRVMVGSPVLQWDEGLWQRLGADAYAPDLRAAADIAKGWLDDNKGR